MTAPIHRLADVAMTAVVTLTCGLPEAARAAKPFGTWLMEDGRAHQN